VENIPMMIKGIMTILISVIDVDELLIMRKEFVRVVGVSMGGENEV
jgi:hypothetical protein